MEAGAAEYGNGGEDSNSYGGGGRGGGGFGEGGEGGGSPVEVVDRNNDDDDGQDGQQVRAQGTVCLRGVKAFFALQKQKANNSGTHIHAWGAWGN